MNIQKEQPVQSPYVLLSGLVVLAILLAGCAFKENAQSKEVKAIDSSNASVGLPEKSQPVDATKSEVLPHAPPATRPVTVPQDPPFTAPEPYSPNAPFPTQFWFGFEHLWTAVPIDGIWAGLPLNADGYTQKIFWWSDLFSLKDELEPELVVTGERLDGEAPPLKASKATNAFAADIGDAMLVGVDFPTLGCWKITGQYKKSELSFAVWVAP